MPSLRTHSLALLLAGQPIPLVGRLLTDRTTRGRDVAIDAGTAKETNPLAGSWVLSDESEATDRNIVLQWWDLNRAERGGVNVLYHHGHDQTVGAAALGRWTGFETRLDIPDTVGRATLARIEWADQVPPAAAHIRAQVEQGIIRGVSVGWLAGRMIPRGELDPADPHYRDPEEGECGMAGEGYIMGSETEPNELVEASITPTPAQPRAYARSRLVGGAARAIEGIEQGRNVAEADLARALALAAQLPGTRAWGKQLVRELLREEPELIRSITGGPTPSFWE